MNQEMRTLPYEFIDQLGYDPSVVERLSFMDKQQSILLSHTWQEYYGTEDVIPVIYLYVHQETETEKDAKLKMIHRILTDKGLYTFLSDQELWALYSAWNMTYLPPVQYNRYIKLLEFVQTHASLFLPTPDEMKGAQRSKEIDNMRLWIQLRDQNDSIVKGRMANPEFQCKREEARINLLQALTLWPNFSLLNGNEDTQHNRVVLRHYFSIQDLIEIGIKPENISTDWWIAQWTFWSTMVEHQSA